MNNLAEFIAALAVYAAHERDWTLPEATAWVQQHVAEAREDYRAKGAPLGDTDEGFIAWLTPRRQPPTA
jgi:hypothetical protein